MDSSQRPSPAGVPSASSLAEQCVRAGLWRATGRDRAAPPAPRPPQPHQRAGCQAPRGRLSALGASSPRAAWSPAKLWGLRAGELGTAGLGSPVPPALRAGGQARGRDLWDVPRATKSSATVPSPVAILCPSRAPKTRPAHTRASAAWESDQSRSSSHKESDRSGGKARAAAGADLADLPALHPFLQRLSQGHALLCPARRSH